jgi:hypothetical protein
MKNLTKFAVLVLVVGCSDEAARIGQSYEYTGGTEAGSVGWAGIGTGGADTGGMSGFAGEGGIGGTGASGGTGGQPPQCTVQLNEPTACAACAACDDESVVECEVHGTARCMAFGKRGVSVSCIWTAEAEDPAVWHSYKRMCPGVIDNEPR